MMSEPLRLYTKTNPYYASLKARYSLCGGGSEKNIQHLVLDFSNSNIKYHVGDSIGIIPQNDPELVEKTLAAMHVQGDEIIRDKHSGEVFSFKEYLIKKSNITDVPKKLVLEVSQRQSDVLKKTRLEHLLNPLQKEEFVRFVEDREVWDFLLENPEVYLAPQELCHLLQPLLPRFYSIASSQNEVGDEVHLTVAMLEYDSNGYQRRGVCTHYLCHLVQLNDPVIPIFIQPSHSFRLPEDSSKHIIMVGPGTGVAPFRAFMQERSLGGAQGKNWLFFGEWHRSHYFLYEDFWRSLELQGQLRLDLAFSRDQEHKIYVQHKMMENGKEIFGWLEEGAYFFVCGDAQYMAKDVEMALLKIIQQHLEHDENAAKHYLKKLRSEKRYLRDVY